MAVVVVVGFVGSDGLFSVFTGFVAVWINTNTVYPGFWFGLACCFTSQ